MPKTELKHCPFCGGEAEMCVSEFPSNYTKSEKGIPKGARIVRQSTTRLGMLFEYREKCYSPRCSVKGCVGRSYKKFATEAEAAEAWNRRADNG